MKNVLKNRTVVGIICIILSLLICFGLLPMTINKINKRETFYIAKTDIAKGTLITADMLEKISVGSYNMPNVIVKDVSSIIGRYAKENIYKGEFFVAHKLDVSAEKENQYLYVLPDGKFAISILVSSFETGLSGKLQAGDIVSVISNSVSKTYIPDELQYVEVLAVTSSQGQDGIDYKTITLLVDRRQALVMARINHSEKVHIALVTRDKDKKEQLLKIQEDIIKNLPPLGDGYNE